MKDKTFLLVVLLVILLTACTQNQRARQIGGTATINLPCNRTMVTATWRVNNLWHLTKPMPDDHTPTTWVFQEDSSYGILNGQVKFIECRTKTLETVQEP